MKCRLNFILPIILILVGVACKDEQIRKAAKASDDMATIVSVAIDTKRQLGQTGSKLITNDEELALTLGLQKVNASVIAFHKQVKVTQTLNPESKMALAGLFKSVVDSVAELNQKGVLGIKNQDAKAKVSTVLAGFTVTFAVVQAVLE